MHHSIFLNWSFSWHHTHTYHLAKVAIFFVYYLALTTLGIPLSPLHGLSCLTLRVYRDLGAVTFPTFKMRRWGWRDLSEATGGKYRSSTQGYWFLDALPRQPIPLFSLLKASLLSTYYAAVSGVGVRGEREKQWPTVGLTLYHILPSTSDISP